jgi:nucleoside-diphosphate-sugar epimerase
VGKLDIKKAPSRKGDVMHTKGSIVYAKELLNFESKVSLEDGLLDTLKWWKLGEKFNA